VARNPCRAARTAVSLKGGWRQVGTWDVGSFDNDTAVDWTYGLEEVADLSYVEAAFDRVLARGAEEISAEDGECSVAAAEVVARLNGQWGEESPYSETADSWVRAHPLVPPPALVAKAIAALERIVTTPSELLELWSESEEAGGWTDAVAEVKARVAS